ncbi:hypothetical protein WJ972_29745 [Achromobacter insuavis]
MSRLRDQQTIAGDLGDILIQGTGSVSNFVAIPARLMKVWRKEKKQAPPKKFGGKSFSRVIAAHATGGVAAVDALLASVSISSTTHANALTAVARSLMHTDPAGAAEFARRAYSLEPKPFRLKWLAFRLHEAGVAVEAEAMLEVLPHDTTFSDSEVRQANRLRNEAKHARLREALQSTGYTERRGKAEQQIAKLEQGYLEQAELIEQRRQAIETLEAAHSHLQQEHSVLQAQHAEQLTVIAELRRAAEDQAVSESRLKVECQSLVSLHAKQAELAAERGHTIEALESEKSLAGREMTVLREQHAEQIELAAAQARRISALEAAGQQLELEKTALNRQIEERAALAAEHIGAVEALRTEATRLKDERVALLAKHAEQFELAAERGRTVTELKQRQAQLESERSDLRTKHEALFRMAEERGREVAQIKSQQVKHAEEAALARSQHAELVAERDAQIKALQEQLRARQTIESDLSVRQQGMHEDLVKAEAQLDLIKDVFFRKPAMKPVPGDGVASFHATSRS